MSQGRNLVQRRGPEATDPHHYTRPKTSGPSGQASNALRGMAHSAPVSGTPPHPGTQVLVDLEGCFSQAHGPLLPRRTKRGLKPPKTLHPSPLP